MTKFINIKIYIIFLLFVLRICANNNNSEANIYEIKMLASQLLLTKQDSVFNTKYKILTKRYKKREFVLALKDALSLIEESENLSIRNRFLLNELVGNIYNKTKKYKSALNFYRTSLKNINEENINEDKFRNIDSLNLLKSKINLRIGAVFLKLHRLEKTNENFENSSLYRDSSIVYYKKLENINYLNSQGLKYKAMAYNNLSSIYQLDTIYDKAESYAKKAILVHKENNDKENLTHAINSLGNIYMHFGNFQKAKETYLEGLTLLEGNESEDAIKVKGQLSYNLAWALRNLKDYKAYDYFEIFYELNYDEQQKETRRLVEEVDAEHQETIEAQKIEMVKEQTKLKKAEESEKLLYFGLIAAFILGILVFTIYNVKLRQKNLQIELSKSDLQQQRQLDKMQREAQRKILNATIDAKEAERKLIAEILHDSVSALLSSANMHLSASKKQLEDNSPIEIDKSQSIILEASNKIRALSHDLVSSVLLKFGLEYAVKDAIKKFGNSELTFEVTTSDIKRYNQEYEIKIFNVIQELLNNIIKHSKAKNAWVTIKHINHQLTIIIEDDGIGFNTESKSISKGIGLNQIEARIHMMKGTLIIDSVKDKGTKIFITVPITERKVKNFLSVV